MERSIRSYWDDEIPIFIARLVDDKGWIMTGGAAQVGNRGVTAATRSCTNWRARMRSVPGLKMRTMSERSGTDLERITSKAGNPLSACSRGTVTNSSTAAAESPRLRVWISTLGGANSGKTSTDDSLTRAMPKLMIAVAAKTTRKRNCRLVFTIQRISSSWLHRSRPDPRLYPTVCAPSPRLRRPPFVRPCAVPVRRLVNKLLRNPGFGAKQQGPADRHHLRSGGRALREKRQVALDVVDADALPDEDQRFGTRVDPGAAVHVIDHRSVGDDPARHPAPQQGQLNPHTLPRNQAIRCLAHHEVQHPFSGAAIFVVIHPLGRLILFSLPAVVLVLSVIFVIQGQHAYGLGLVHLVQVTLIEAYSHPNCAESGGIRSGQGDHLTPHRARPRHRLFTAGRPLGQHHALEVRTLDRLDPGRRAADLYARRGNGAPDGAGRQQQRRSCQQSYDKDEREGSPPFPSAIRYSLLVAHAIASSIKEQPSRRRWLRAGLAPTCSLRTTHVDSSAPQPEQQEHSQQHHDRPSDGIRKHASGIKTGERRHCQVDARTGNRLAGGLLAVGRGNEHHVHHVVPIENRIDPPRERGGLA